MDRSRSKGSSTTQAYVVGSGAFKREVMRRSSDNKVVTRVVSLSEPVNYELYDDRESISDMVGHTWEFNPCVHLRRIPYRLPGYKLPSKIDTYGWLSPADWWYTYGHDGGYLSNSLVSFQGLCTSHPTQLPNPSMGSIDWADLTDQVGVQLDGHMQVSQNLLVSLMTIGQTLSMVKKPFGGLAKLKKISKDASLSNLLRTGSSAYLEYRYGWLNFKRDIEAISNVWQEVRRHMEFLEKTVHKFTSLSQRVTDSYDASSLCTFKSLGSDQTGSVLLYLSQVTRTACFSLDVKRDEASLTIGRMDHVLRRLGTGELAEALWDLVPWSFVVDWFTHINRFVRQAPILWNSADLRRMGYSVKTEHHGYVKTRYSGYSSFSGWSPAAWSTHETQVVQRMYQRTAGFPPSCSSVGLFGDLNKTQIADGIALIVQRI